LHKILVANRGEIAVRVIRACRDMGLASVAVFSDCDRAARHVRMADEAVAIGANPPADSYLRIDRLIDAARLTGADTVHPGYGFLAENAGFAAACRDAGLIFIGPTPETIARMGSKTSARQAAIAAGMPVVPGSDDPLGPDVDDATIATLAAGIGYPIMVKAVAGGGGKGMRIVMRPEALADAVRAARSEAGAYFADPAIYLERWLARPRHVEVQVLADHHGTVLACVERECSLQRRHQKVIEESPSPVVTPELRARITGAAASVARSVGYTNVGTVECLLDEEGRFYFLEMNTRLQVEHPVTEMVTGIDIVQWQIRIARGERLTLSPADLLVPRGHAIECRVYAEDADLGFLPSPGRITSLRAPAGPGIRDDSGVDAADEVSIYYDPMISKLIAHGEDRAQATARMRRALQEYEILGIRTSLPFFVWMLRQPEFIEARFHTGYLDEVLQRRRGEPFSEVDPSVEEVACVAACLIELSPMALSSMALSPKALSPGALSSEARSGQAPWRVPVDARPPRADVGWVLAGRLEGLRR
jgi:acetyl-CoA carboxylase biotin carboxylase subunit